MNALREMNEIFNFMKYLLTTSLLSLTFPLWGLPFWLWRSFRIRKALTREEVDAAKRILESNV